MREGLHNVSFAALSLLTEREARRELAGDRGETEAITPDPTTIERICELCGTAFLAKRNKVLCGRARFCSRACASTVAGRLCHETRDQRGARNPGWKGGVSSQPYRYTQRFKARFPEKWRAQRLIQAAIRAGRLVRPAACSQCAVACHPHGHHDDYTQPLNVRWLCRACHLAHHQAKRGPKPKSAAA